MNIHLDKAKAAMRAKMTSYSAMLDYRYKNLCVKTTTEALLPIQVERGNAEVPLEAVAKAVIVDDEHYMILPNSVGLESAICYAFMKTHPQLRQEVYDAMHNPYADESIRASVTREKEMFRERTGEDLLLPNVLILTTPEVNDDARNVLDKSVDALRTSCEVLCRREYSQYKSEMNIAMASDKPEDIKSANEDYDAEYDKLWQDVEKITDEEHQVIEEANKRYHQRKLAKQNERNNGHTDEESKVLHSMKFGEYEE